MLLALLVVVFPRSEDKAPFQSDTRELGCETPAKRSNPSKRFRLAREVPSGGIYHTRLLKMHFTVQ